MRREGRAFIIMGVVGYLIIHVAVLIAGAECSLETTLWPDIVLITTVIVGVIRLTSAEIIEAIRESQK
jgi:hypothetical protein